MAYAPAQPPAYPTSPIPMPGRRRRRWRGVVFGLALLVLFGLLGAQTFWLYQLSDRLAQAESRSAADHQAGNAAVQAVASRVAQLEGAAFHADQIAAVALPSVFRVKAGAYSGTAWAVGKSNPDGGANLFTNYHVVEAVWVQGERTVNIEHRELLYKATIVKVDKEHDLAHLSTTERFPGLTISSHDVKPGQPVVVVGAPLGLESSVTTGVVSAFRKLEGTDDTYVQFDAPINPGNSGGPVINAQGQVVGIATAKLRNSEGIGLAIPIALACQLFSICG